MSRRYFFVVNPRSANGKTAPWWQKILPVLKETTIDFEWAFTNGPYTAPVIVGRAISAGYQVIVSVGGDGTAYEVANGLIQDDRVAEGRALAIWPRGTGSDLARLLQLPREDQDVIAMLMAGNTRWIDVGRADFVSWSGEPAQRYFLNVAEAGLGGETVARVNRTSKFFGGFVSFLWGTIISIIRFQNKEMRVVIDGRLFRQGKAVLVACGNGQYFGGGMKICPGAVIDDGLFDFTGIDGTGKMTLLRNLARIYQGTHLALPVVWHGRGKTLRLESTDTVMVNLDGEQPGVLPAEFSILPQLLPLIVPAAISSSNLPQNDTC